METASKRFRVSCFDTTMNQDNPPIIYRNVEVAAPDSGTARRQADEQNIEAVRHVPKRTYQIEPMEG